MLAASKKIVTSGNFSRRRFRNWVTPDGSPGPTGEGGFAAARGRYHLYVALACPWAHRTIIFRKLKGLENVISMSTVSPDMLQDGWTFNKDEGSTGDDVNGKSKLSEIYLLTDPRYSGRVSVPVLWDKQRKTIVNNGKIVFENDAARSALELLRRGFAEGVLPSSNFALGRDPFMDGTVAMKIIGPWFVKELDELKIRGLHFDVTPVPAADGSDPSNQFAFADLRSIAIFSTTKHPDAAARFVAHQSLCGAGFRAGALHAGGRLFHAPEPFVLLRAADAGAQRRRRPGNRGYRCWVGRRLGRNPRAVRAILHGR